MESIKDREAFKKYLLQEKKLGKRTVILYIVYYDCFDVMQLSQEYISKFIVKHKNNPPVRAFVKNYLEFHKVDLKEIEFPKRPSGRMPVRVPREVSRKDIDKLRAYLYGESFKKGLIFDIVYQGALRRVEVLSIKLNSFI